MENRVREFKLAVPIVCEVKDAEIFLTDKYENKNSIPMSHGTAFGLGDVDKDGYLKITVTYHVPKLATQTTILPQSIAHINGYTLFHTNLSKSYGYGGQKSVFEYYKKDSDLSYYALVKKENKTRKVLLGSLHEPNSRIFQVACTINDKIGIGQRFEKGALRKLVAKPLNGARIVKSVLDILTKEGYLVMTEEKLGKRYRTTELYSKTEKLEKYFADPRSWQKTNGLNIGSSAMTPNQ